MGAFFLPPGSIIASPNRYGTARSLSTLEGKPPDSAACLNSPYKH